MLARSPAPRALFALAALATTSVPAAADSKPLPLSTVRALEGGGDVTIAILAALGRTKRLGWEPGANGAAYAGVVLDEVIATLRVDGGPSDRAESIAIFERFASPDPDLQRPPLIALTTPGVEYRGVVENLSYECATDHCDVRLALLQTDDAKLAEPKAREPAKPIASVAPDKRGFLTLDTYPWTRVSEDGKPLGATPLLRVPLAPGVHKLTLENRDQGIRQTYAVTIENGRAVARRLGLK